MLEQIGGLVIGRRDDGFLEQTRAVARLHGIAHRNLSNRAAEGWVSDVRCARRHRGVLRAGGRVRPSRGGDHGPADARPPAGAELRLGESVLAWSASAGAVTVTTDTGTLEARELVLCAGAWITKLVPESAGLFAVYPQILHWFGIRRGYEALRRMPIFIWEMAGERDAFTHLSGGFYGFPAIDGPHGGLKLATERYDATVDPDRGSRHLDTDLADSARTLHERYLARHFPWVTAEPLRTTSCLYTCTRASRFIIDQHPDHPNVRIVAACSGHGFKHSAAIGEAVAQSISVGISEIDLTPFALADGFPS